MSVGGIPVCYHHLDVFFVRAGSVTTSVCTECLHWSLLCHNPPEQVQSLPQKKVAN